MVPPLLCLFGSSCLALHGILTVGQNAALTAGPGRGLGGVLIPPVCRMTVLGHFGILLLGWDVECFGS
jgi:hypothetical protein